MSKTFIIGITGKAFAGKTTVADMLQKLQPPHVTTECFGLGDALKQECAEATGIDINLFYSKDKAIKDAVRPLLQWWGTEYRRNPSLGGNPNYWTERARARLEEVQIAVQRNELSPHLLGIIHDVRFDDEAEFVLQFDAHANFIIHVVAPHQEVTDHAAHVSEAGINESYVTATIHNNHSLGLEVLQAQVTALYNNVILPAIDI